MVVGQRVCLMENVGSLKGFQWIVNSNHEYMGNNVGHVVKESTSLTENGQQQ